MTKRRDIPASLWAMLCGRSSAMETLYIDFNVWTIDIPRTTVKWASRPRRKDSVLKLALPRNNWAEHNLASLPVKLVQFANTAVLAARSNVQWEIWQQQNSAGKGRGNTCQAFHWPLQQEESQGKVDRLSGKSLEQVSKDSTTFSSSLFHLGGLEVLIWWSLIRFFGHFLFHKVSQDPHLSHWMAYPRGANVQRLPEPQSIFVSICNPRILDKMFIMPLNSIHIYDLSKQVSSSSTPLLLLLVHQSQDSSWHSGKGKKLQPQA